MCESDRLFAEGQRKGRARRDIGLKQDVKIVVIERDRLSEGVSSERLSSISLFSFGTAVAIAEAAHRSGKHPLVEFNAAAIRIKGFEAEILTGLYVVSSPFDEPDSIGPARNETTLCCAESREVVM